MMHVDEVQKKINEYETFVEEKLKKDLGDIEKNLNLKSTKFKEWEEVKAVVKTVTEFKEKDKDMSVRLDIGNGIMATGEITEYERTYVSIGLGYLLEMDCEEADKYSSIRLKLLTREIDQLRKLAVNVKVHIKMVLLAISELQATLIPPSSTKKR